jgi:hypothetical protein
MTYLHGECSYMRTEEEEEPKEDTEDREEAEEEEDEEEEHMDPMAVDCMLSMAILPESVPSAPRSLSGWPVGAPSNPP